jgi:hypothetical protein
MEEATAGSGQPGDAAEPEIQRKIIHVDMDGAP